MTNINRKPDTAQRNSFYLIGSLSENCSFFNPSQIFFMNIEFHNPKGQVKEWVVDYLKEQLTELHRRDKQISRASVTFKQHGLEPFDKVCELDVTIYSNSLYIHRNAASYEQAMRDALDQLKEKIEQHIKLQNEPPDELTSTVKV